MKSLFLIITATILSINFLFAQTNEIERRAENFFLQKGIALKGYDPIAFFNQSRAVQANGTIIYAYNGVKYFFTSSNHLNQFKTTPDKFEPKYGGWCAYHMSKKGNKVAANPQHFSILNGRLYFFDSGDSKYKWENGIKQLKKEADNNWNKFMQ